MRYLLVAVVAFVLGSATVVEAAQTVTGLFRLADGTDAARLAAVDAAGNVQVKANGGTVSIGNLPATQDVGGTVAVSNFPASQTVAGTVNIGGLPTTRVIGLVDTNVASGSTGTLGVDVSHYAQVRVGVAVVCTPGSSVSVSVASDGNSPASFTLGTGQATCSSDPYFAVFEMPGVHIFVQAANFTGANARIIIVAMGR